MKIFAKCPTCKVHVSIKTSAVTRPQLAQEKGETFRINCAECGKDFTRHTNEIRAKDDHKVLFNAFMISGVLSILFFFFFGLMGTITILVPLIIWQMQAKKVHAFNSYML